MIGFSGLKFRQLPRPENREAAQSGLQEEVATVFSSGPESQRSLMLTPADGASIGNFRGHWQEGPQLVLRRSRKVALSFGVIGVVLLLWGTAAVISLAVKVAIVLTGCGILCLILSLGHIRVIFDETGVRLSSLLGLRETHVVRSDLQDVRIVLDDLPVQGCTVVFGLKSGKRLALDARDALSSPNAPNHVLFALWIGDWFDLPVEIEGQVRDGETPFANLLLKLTERCVGENSIQNARREDSRHEETAPPGA